MIKFIFGFIFGFITLKIYKVINKYKFIILKKFLITYIYIIFSLCVLFIANYGNSEQYIFLLIVINLFYLGIYVINVGINNENLLNKNEIKTTYYFSIFLFVIFNFWLKIDKGIVISLNVLIFILCSTIIPMPTIKQVLLKNNIYKKIFKCIKKNINIDTLCINIKNLFEKICRNITDIIKQILICFICVILYVVVYLVLLKLNI